MKLVIEGNENKLRRFAKVNALLMRRRGFKSELVDEAPKLIVVEENKSELIEEAPKKKRRTKAEIEADKLKEDN